MSDTSDLIATRTLIIQRKKEYLTALAADSLSPQPSYSLEGESIDRSGWRTSIANMIKTLDEELDMINKTINAMDPYIISTVQRL